MAQNAFNLLKSDHKQLEALFTKLTSTSQRAVKTRAALLTKLKTALEIHMRVEESVFYPAVNEMELTHEIAIELVEQHALLEQLLTEMQALSVQDETWQAKLKLLHDNFQSHIKAEEVVMFQKADEIFSHSQLVIIAERLKSAKQQAKATIE